MKASLQPKPMYCSRDYYYSSRFNQQYEKPTPIIAQLWYLGTLWGTKFGQKMKPVWCMQVVENGTESSGGIQKYILVDIFIIITNLCI